MTPDPPPHETRIRALFARVGDAVTPSSGGLDRIRARIIARRPWWRRLKPRTKGRRPGM